VRNTHLRTLLGVRNTHPGCTEGEIPTWVYWGRDTHLGVYRRVLPTWVCTEECYPPGCTTVRYPPGCTTVRDTHRGVERVLSTGVLKERYPPGCESVTHRGERCTSVRKVYLRAKGVPPCEECSPLRRVFLVAKSVIPVAKSVTHPGNTALLSRKPGTERRFAQRSTFPFHCWTVLKTVTHRHNAGRCCPYPRL